MRPVKWKITGIILIGIVQVTAALAYVWLSKHVIDLATSQVEGNFIAAVLLLVGVMFFEILCRLSENYLRGFVTIDTQNKMREVVFASVMRSTWQGREKFHSGDTINRLEEDIRVCVDFVCSNFTELAVTLVQLIAATVFLAVLAPQLAFILLIIMPVAVLGSRLLFRRMRSITNEIRAGDSAVQGYMQENIQHRMIVRVLGGTANVLRRLGLLQKDVKKKTMRRLGYSTISRAVMNTGFATGYAVAFLWGVFGLRDGTVTYGLMVAFLQLVNRVQRPVVDITRHIPAFIRALSSEERLMELEELPQEEEAADIKLEGAPGVRVRNLTYTYPGKTKDVISGMDFNFAPGTLTAITGPTGAGKSTLARLILGLVKPVSGSVSIYSGAEEYPAGVAMRCNFMYVPQGNTLMSGTIRQNLLLAAPDATEEQMKEVLHLAVADFVFDLPDGLDTVCMEVGGGLSEGQAQRIAIARGLLRPGGILVLDEATSALDAATEMTLLERIYTRFSGKKTIICITHREAVGKYADAVLDVPDL